MMWLQLAITKMMFVATSIDFSLDNLTTLGVLRIAFDPYYAIFGNFTWGVIFGFIAAGLYINERSIGTLATFLILAGIFGAVVLPAEFIFLFSILLTFIITVIFYVSFIESRTV